MSLYDRDYMRGAQGGAVQSRRPRPMPTRKDELNSHRLSRGEQVGLLVGGLAVIGLLLCGVLV